jgi:hypothetical protein
VEDTEHSPSSPAQAEYAEGRDDVENRWMISPLRTFSVVDQVCDISQKQLQKCFDRLPEFTV